MTIRVLLVDDHEVVRTGVRALIDAAEDLKVVGEAGSAADGIKRVGFDDPHVVVLDVRLPDRSGVEACREIRERFPEVKVLMLTTFADDEALMASIMAGASGYVLKRIRGNELVDDIRRVAAGESLLDPTLVDKLFSRLRGEESASDPLLSRLSPQERTILGHIAEGKTNREIAEDMFLAEKTVKNYVSNMLSKLGMSRRTEAAAYLVAHQRDDADHVEEAWPEGFEPS